MYRETKACNLLKFNQIENGIMQVCPLSALLFIPGIEPLLQAMRRNTQIKTNQKLKLIAYTDDISFFQNRVQKQVSDEIENLSHSSGGFCSIHRKKNKVLMTGVNDLPRTKVDELINIKIIIYPGKTKNMIACATINDVF